MPTVRTASCQGGRPDRKVAVDLAVYFDAAQPMDILVALEQLEPNRVLRCAGPRQ